MHLQELIIYNILAEDAIIKNYIDFTNAKDPGEARKSYFNLIKELIAVEMPFETYLFTKLLEVDNPLLDRISRIEYEINPLDIACLKNDLGILKKIVVSNIDDRINEVGDKQNILGHLESKLTGSHIIEAYRAYFSANAVIDDEAIADYIELIRAFGTGIFAGNHAFYINLEQQLVPIKEFSPLPWDQIYDYESQKEALLENTKALVGGRPCHHVILEGASGTGKSSSVKAVVDLYKEQKLRLIQIYKSQLRNIPKLLEMLDGSIFKFIIFIDDLSFEVNDDDYKMLKSYIEGGVIHEATNVAFYVTSNRKHLIKEVRSDREGDIHLQDFINETTSLSDRFGLHLTFIKPVQKEYFEMIEKMLNQENIPYNQEEMEIEARRWSIKHGDMSGRIAMQFVKHIKMGHIYG